MDLQRKLSNVKVERHKNLRVRTLLFTRTVYVWTKNWLDEAISEKMGSISGGEHIADNLNCTECLHIYKYVNIATLKN